MVDVVWKIRNLYQRWKVVDLVHSRNSKYLRIEGLFSLTKSIFGSV